MGKKIFVYKIPIKVWKIDVTVFIWVYLALRKQTTEINSFIFFRAGIKATFSSTNSSCSGTQDLILDEGFSWKNLLRHFLSLFRKTVGEKVPFQIFENARVSNFWSLDHLHNMIWVTWWRVFLWRHGQKWWYHKRFLKTFSYLL